MEREPLTRSETFIAIFLGNLYLTIFFFGLWHAVQLARALWP